MKPLLLSGTALAAAFAIALPVWAQTAPSTPPPASYAQLAPPAAAPTQQVARKRYRRRGSRAPSDNVADQFPRQRPQPIIGGIPLRAERSVQHYRECAARLRSLSNLEFNLALREQLEIVASDYDEIADEIDQKAEAPR